MNKNKIILSLVTISFLNINVMANTNNINDEILTSINIDNDFNNIFGGNGFGFGGGDDDDDDDDDDSGEDSESVDVSDDEENEYDKPLESDDNEAQNECGDSFFNTMMCIIEDLKNQLEDAADNDATDEEKQLIIKDTLNVSDKASKFIYQAIDENGTAKDSGYNHVSPFEVDEDGNNISSEKSKERFNEYLVSDKYGWDIIKDIENNESELILAKNTHLTNNVIDIKNIFDGKTKCPNNYNIILSDGVFNQDDDDGDDSNNTSGDKNPYEKIENLLSSDENVNTLAISFAEKDLTLYNLLAEKGGVDMGIDKPFYAKNSEELLNKILETMKLTLDNEYSSITPVFSNEIGDEKFIFQSSFLIKEHNQWEGQLKKFVLFINGEGKTVVGDGTDENTPIWNAGQKLFDLEDVTKRNIITYNGSKEIKLSDSNATDLNIEESNLDTFKDWLYGKNKLKELDYPEDGNRWMLGDIYNSKIKIYNKPDELISTEENKFESFYRNTNGYSTFVVDNKERNKKIIAGSNDGMIHIFDEATGDENGAIIPPFMLNKLEKMILRDSEGDIIMNKSNSIQGIDGEIIIKDIYDSSSSTWKTIMVVNSGDEYKSFSIFDITSIDDIKHIFSVENIIDNDDGDIKIWNGEKAELSYKNDDDSDYGNYDKLSKLSNKPLLMLIPENNDKDANLVYRLIISNGDISNPEILIINPFDGKIVKTITIDNPVYSNLTIVNAETTKKMYGIKGSFIYYTDNKGKLYKLNLTNYKNLDDDGNDQGGFELYEKDKIFETKDDSTLNSYTKPIPFLEKINNKTVLNIVYGTGDKNQLDYYTGKQNYLIKVIDGEFPLYNNNFNNDDEDNGFLTIDDLAKLNNEDTNNICDNEDDDEDKNKILTNGYVVEMTFNESSQENEKIFQDILVKNHTLYFTSYLNKQCEIGSSFLYSIDSVCGYGHFTDGNKKIEISKGTSSGVASNKDQIFISVSKDTKVDGLEELTQSGNLLYGKAQGMKYIPLTIKFKKESDIK
jgi:hypothetical protein